MSGRKSEGAWLKKLRYMGVLMVLSWMILSPLTLALRTTPEQHFGHNFSEEYWSIEYEILNRRLIQDYHPGNFSEDYADPLEETNPFGKVNTFISYIGLGNVRTLFFAAQNFTADSRDREIGGYSTYQTLLQTYPVSTGEYVIVQNTFIGLIASILEADEHYFGYTLNSNQIGSVLNRSLSDHLGYTAITSTMSPEVTVHPIEKKSLSEGGSEYIFGMNYSNVYVYWHGIGSDFNLNQSLQPDEILDEIVGFSRFDSINFTYILSEMQDANGLSTVVTTSEYNIGAMTDLWIRNDTESDTVGHNGNFISLPYGVNISRYNESDSIASRLGPESGGNMSLSISNHARIVVLSRDSTKMSEFVDFDSDPIHPNIDDRSLAGFDMVVDDVPVFSVDFISKPNYTLNNEDVYNAPVSIFPADGIRNPAVHRMDQFAMGFIEPYLRGAVMNHFATGNRRPFFSENAIELSRTETRLFYVISFPVWEGKSINQDPIFVAFPSLFDLDNARFRFVVIFGLLAGAVAIPTLLIRKYRIR